MIHGIFGFIVGIITTLIIGAVYAHCIDCTEDCPEDCFRAQLAREAIAKHWAIASWMHFKNTDECPKTKDRN